MDLNPYAAPLDTTAPPPLPVSNEAEVIRREHIKHEASVKGIGSLYFIGSIFILIGGVTMVFAGLKGGNMGTAELAMMVLFPALGLLGLWVGYGIRKLSPAARVVAGILTGINLVLSIFGLPQSIIAILINTYILNLLFSKKGTMVFSAPYKEIIAQTPHVKYKTSIVVWIVLGIFVLVVVVGILAAVFSTRW
ncbi:hypothetical protein [Haloferula sp. BvORR071]|uniref:hypothetical protein n=1 Tax=Haloferula sp. BvORR071 TaxID=1396141 RepID=UPI000557D68A|nr:hypothetical protein [Haloferula sp. BvORR071]